MSTYKTMIDSLLETYGAIYEHSSPAWAVHKKNNPNELVKPTIPFVGKHYAEQSKKILVYASAENLSDYYSDDYDKHRSDDGLDLDNNAQAANRHRVMFDATKNSSFFPNVHIQPINDGTLATAVLYITSQLMDIETNNPGEFYEKIAIANYGKYTKETEQQENIRTGKGKYRSDRNTDYTQMPIKKAREYLRESHPFLKGDIEILRPDIIILPKRLYSRDIDFFAEIAHESNAKIVGIYQMGPTPINCIISKRYPPKDVETLHPSIKEWTSKIKRVSQEKYLSVFTYLDEVIAHDLR